MGWPSDQQPEDAYRRWLEALAKAMGSDSPAEEPESPPRQPEPAGLLEFDPAGEASQDRFSHREPEENWAPTVPTQTPPETPAAACSPRIWDLCKPYVLFVAIVLVGGLAGIGGLVWLTQWLIPPTRPSAPAAPIEAQWEVRRRGLHILPDTQTTSPNPASSAQQAPSDYSAPEHMSVPSTSEQPDAENP